ncbi:PREDICTED: proteasome inhibitor PI31 subunit-like [Amphimedon queenslandica]|uniref:Proteasome inhibitor PI31 subunit n=1 Tax=Amphimedon queenslandica TaxID=400682 RepID=A0A1X7UME9_AMPQE|nr:PREDICTED: proteasome inhibitor PI31 subunit-like [Amphimedon queenslandica]|eukprot:XP_011404694.1 PREDICTED: proteasome inhibitor PI31 subunit-like [Amphimedon queenslandica]
MAASTEEVTIDSIFEKGVAGSNVKRVNDLIVLALHASLLSEGFSCLSASEHGFQSGDVRSEPIATPTNPSLPDGWNESSDAYVLQYKDDKTNVKSLIKILPLGDQLLINTISSDKTDDVHTITLPTSGYIKEKPDEPVSITSLKNIIRLFSVLHKEVIEKLKKKESKEAKDDKQTNPKREDIRNPSLLEDDRRQGIPGFRPDLMGSGRHPFEIGRGDLSPFGGPGGGMIMDPFRGSGGAFGPPMAGFPPPRFHPPGARYDPVSPFGPPRFHPGRGPRGGGGLGLGLDHSQYGHGPDPDHLPPPGYDDMFS